MGISMHLALASPCCLCKYVLHDWSCGQGTSSSQVRFCIRQQHSELFQQPDTAGAVQDAARLWHPSPAFLIPSFACWHPPKTPLLLAAQALEELREAGLNEEQVELLWDLYLRARAEEERGASRGGAGADAAAAGGSKGARLGGMSLGVISRLLITLHLMYKVAPSFTCCSVLHICLWVGCADFEGPCCAFVALRPE